MGAADEVRPDRLERFDAAGAGQRRPGDRATTLVVGAAVPALVACAAWWLGAGFVAAVAAGGVVVGPLVAVRRAEHLARPGWLQTSIVLGIQAPLALCLLISAYAIAGSLLAALDPDPAYAYGAFLFVIPYGMLFGTPVAIPVAIVAGFLVHRASGMSPARARRHVGALAIAAVAGSVVTLGSVTGLLARVVPGAAPIDWAGATAAVRLTLTIENHSSRDLDIMVDWDSGDGGRSGSIAGAPACSVVVSRFDLDGVAWAVGAVDEAELDPLGPPFATAVEWPGSNPAITLRIAADGAGSVVAGSRAVLAPDGPWPPERVVPCP